MNPSCENYSNCPANLGELYQLSDIHNPNAATPDFFHVCYSGMNNYAFVPDNFCGYQLARTGNAYIGISPFSIFSDTREYATFHFSDTLTSQKTYLIEFYVSIGDSMKHTTDRLGAYISLDSIYQNDGLFLSYLPHVENPSGNFLSDKVNWIKISGNYIASGGEKYITIGNFYSDSLTDTVSMNSDPISPTNKYGAYYYIDDVSVIEIPDTVSVIELNKQISISVYPNPSSGKFSIVSEVFLQSPEIYISDITGKIVFEKVLNEKLKRVELNLDLPPGIYFLRIKQEDSWLMEKLIIN